MKIVERIKMAIRRRKMDRRIIRQAKAMGVWGKPMVLGGRALELYAKRYRMKRELGENDNRLRARIIAEDLYKRSQYSE